MNQFRFPLPVLLSRKVNQPIPSRSLEAEYLEGHVLKSGQPRFGFDGQSLLTAGCRSMAYLDSHEVVNLAFTDGAGMVVPRTGEELIYRGFTPARETFIREISGTVTNTFLAGWLGGLAALGLNRYNARAMNFNAYIDAPSLEAYGAMAEKVLAEGRGKTPNQLREAFLTKVLEGIRSSDTIPKRYRSHFVIRDARGGFQGLNKDHIDALVKNHYMGTRVPVVEHEAEQVYKSSPISQLATSPKAEKLAIRSALTRRLFSKTAKTKFIEEAYNYATQQGHLSDEVFLKGYEAKLGTRPLKDVLNSLRNFMIEHFNRALAEHGKSFESALDEKSIKMLHARLFCQGGTTWLQKHLLPNLKDGLVQYAMKSKLLMVVLPVAFTMFFGASVVVFNNLFTRKQNGGKKFFPGEQAFAQSRRTVR
jgi:hypothetical protein